MSIQWELVGDAIKAGKYNLLLGAGVSLDSISGTAGEPCPSAGTLRTVLQSALPDVREGSSLSRLYKTMTPVQIEQQITNRFQGCQPGQTVKAISKFRWKRIFTLNVDDALESAYETASDAAQRFKSLNYNDNFSEIRDVTSVPIIHLHGFSRRAADGYVFDIKEYMKSVRQNNIWSHVLGDLIRSEPFIILGASLEEPDMAYFLSDRHDVYSRPDRAPSILVEPSPDAGTKVDCEEYSLDLYKGRATDFLTDIDVRFPARPSATASIEDNLGAEVASLQIETGTLAEFHADFERVPSDPLFGSDGGTNFAYGHRASWLDIQNGRDVARYETVGIQSRIAAPNNTRTTLITGLAGSGKSTVLRRIAWNLAQAGRRCFWLRSVGRARIDSAEAVLGSLSGMSFVLSIILPITLQKYRYWRVI